MRSSTVTPPDAASASVGPVVVKEGGDRFIVVRVETPVGERLLVLGVLRVQRFEEVQAAFRPTPCCQPSRRATGSQPSRVDLVQALARAIRCGPELEFDLSSHRKPIGLVKEHPVPLPAPPQGDDVRVGVALVEVFPAVHVRRLCGLAVSRSSVAGQDADGSSFPTLRPRLCPRTGRRRSSSASETLVASRNGPPSPMRPREPQGGPGSGSVAWPGR